LGLAAAALLTAAVYLPLHEKQVRLSEIEARLDRARSEAAVADSLRKQVTEMLEQSRFVVEQREVQPTVVALLDVVTKLLPDDTWLIRFRVSKRQVQMSGYSAAASSLIATLEASELLTEVRFASPVTLDPRVGRERFDLTASIAQGAGS
jgi:general secretion pathway protein L